MEALCSPVVAMGPQAKVSDDFVACIGDRGWSLYGAPVVR
jgi:hypothetical protein